MAFNVKSLDEFLIFDGAMGTMLQKSGLRTGDLPEIYNIEKPDLVQGIHKSYVEAGADIITTNTLGANELKLNGSPFSVEDVIIAGVKLAKAAGGKWVALDIGSLGQMIKPLGEISFQEAYNLFKRQVICGADSGADLILIETFIDIYEAKAAILAAKEHSNLPVFCTISFQADGKTFLGTDALTAVMVLQGLGVDALGINCSLGPEEMMPILQDFARYSRVPLVAQANAGLPSLIGEETVFPVGPEAFAAYAQEMGKLGVQIIGGCCGTTPEHIKAIKHQLSGLKPGKRNPEQITCACSGTQTVVFDDNTTVIGERINPTGKKKIKEALKANQLDLLLQEAVEQTNFGADVLDVNVGLPEIDEVKVLVEAVTKIQGIVDTPLQLDSVNPEALAAAARVYNGKPIINSVNGKGKVMEEIFPIAKKYGASVIGLTLDDKGIPSTGEDRLAVARKIVAQAKVYGIPKEDLLIDCLVLTASAQQELVKETIKAVRLVKEELGVKTILGVSNVSYGLPNRQLLNRTFLAGALAAGLDAAIIDPLVADIRDTVAAFRVLNNSDKEAKCYIDKFGGNKKEVVRDSKESSLQELIRDGRRHDVGEKVLSLLKTNTPQEIINQYFIPALDEIGKGYEKGVYFLPHLIRSAETVKTGLGIIKTHAFQEMESLNRGTILLATVKGDIHDIGKNIAKMLLENYGFTVIDLGKDVDIRIIVDTAKRFNIKLVGLSALMTTTVRNMALTIAALRKELPDCKVMVGGAVLNPQYATMIEADFYAVDSQAGVQIASDYFKA